MKDEKIDLSKLAIEICQEPPGSPLRQRKLTVMIRELSRKLWKENSPYYADALQDTYSFLCRRLCDLYDSDKAKVETWLNNHLKWRLFSLKKEGYEEAKTRVYVPSDPEEGRNPIDNIPAPSEPEYSTLDALRDWLLEDKKGVLKATHMLKRPDINAQVISLRRLPPDPTSWSDLAKEYKSDIPNKEGVSALSTFYRRKCIPLLKKFMEEQDSE